MNPTKPCFLMEDYFPSKIYSFTDPEEAQGRTQGTPAPSVCCQIPQVALAKQSLGARSPSPKWNNGISADKAAPSRTAGSNHTDGQGRDGGASPLPCLPLLLKVSCGLTCVLTPLDNFFFIIVIVNPAKMAPQRQSLLSMLGSCGN